MKPWLRFFLGGALALLTGSAAHAAASLTPSGISASPSSVKPGDSVTFTITTTNGAAATTAPTNQNDFPAGGTAHFLITLTNISSGYSFTLGSTTLAAGVGTATTTVTEGGGSGTFNFAATVPTQLTEAGAYSATVQMANPSVGAAAGTVAVSSSVLTVTGKPNFVITGLTYASGTSYVGGNTVPMTITWVNQSSTNGIPNVPWRSGTNGFSTYYRIKVVLSTNATFGDADDFQLTIQDFATKVNADGSTQTYSWTQLLPGNFAGSYYVLAKIDALGQVDQNNNPTLTVNGDDIWGTNSLNSTATLINLLPSNFPSMAIVSHANGVATSANAYSDNPSMSSDGRYVTFASDASNLVANDTNAVRDIFLFDSQTNTSRRLNVSQQGTQANAPSNNPVISAKGRYVAFSSDANNLILGDTNGFADIFVVDTITGLISRVSVATSGTQANNPSFKPAISSTGRYIVFESTATNLDANYTLSAAGGVSHVYLRDRDVSNSGTFDTAGNTATRLVDADVTTPASVVGNANAIQAAISSDGTMIAFSSKATNLVSPATTAARQHVYVRSTANVGTATSGIKNIDVVNTTAAEGNSDGQTPSLSQDGRYVAFASLATNLVAGDTNGVSDIFVYDTSQAVATPVVRRMSLTNAGAQGTDPTTAGFQLGSINPTISATGRYVAFASLDSNLTAGDANGQFKATDSNTALDIFVRDRDSTASGTFDTVAATTQMVSVNTFGYQTNGLLGTPSTAANNIYPVMSADGRFVALPSDAESSGGLAYGATNQLPLDSNSSRDIFLFDRRLNSLPNASVVPVVTITNPGNGGTALVNTPISVTASATTTIGVVANVQFFVNGTSLGTSSVFPYSAIWTPTAVGSYTLSALVTDSFGNLGVSTNVTVTINAAPSVGITTPVSGNSIVVGTVTTVKATAAASNPGAFVNTVQFFANGQSLGTVTAPASSVSFTPSVSWTPASTGNVTLTAVALDTVGTQTTSPTVAVSVIAAGGGGGGGAASPPPTVSLSPAPATSVTVNTPVSLTATATAASGFNLVSVQYFANGVSIGSASAFPYLAKWTPTAVGTYSITAVATDNVGSTTTSVAASVTVTAGSAPTIALVSPNSGATYAVGSPIALSASTTLGAGLVSGVEFFANNVSIGSKGVSASGQGSAPFFNLQWSPAAAGTYVFTAVVTDTSGNRTTSTSVTVTVTSVAAPVVTVTSPTTGTAIVVNKTLKVSASATAGSGASITSVAFFTNGQSLGTSSIFPFSTSWTPTAPGTYVLQAVATDSFGTQTTSSTVSVTVGAGSSSLPFVYLTSVPNGTNVAANTPVFVAANAGDPDGVVASVEFYANGALIGTKTTAPYAVVWVPTSATSYSITAIVTDDAGNRVTSTASSITALVQVGVPPVAGIAFNNPTVDTPTGSGTATTPALFTPVKVNYGSKLIFSVGAVSQGGSIANVQFFANGTNIATVSAAPYYTTYTLNTLSDVTVVALATDSSGNAVYTTPILISTQPNDPTGDLVTLVSPLDGATYTVGQQIVFSATHNFGTANPPAIDFYVNGSQFTTVKASGATGGVSAPYQFLVGLARAGTYDIHAVLRVGNTTTISTPARITVTSRTAPTVGIRSPATGGSYVIGTSLTIAADAAAIQGTIQNVQFFVNGSLLSKATTAPYIAPWNPGSPGIYTLTAVATDDAGNQTISAPVTLTYTGNAPPVVALSTPAVGSSVVAGSPLALVAAASDTDGSVTSVRFLANGNVVGTGSAAPFTATWSPSASGVYSVVAQATDNSGNVTTSAAVSVVVVAARSPVVKLTAPGGGIVLPTGATTTLTAAATSPDGTVATVQFLANGRVIANATTSPYTATWTPNTPGTYAVVAQVTDNSGNVATSAVVSVSVVAARPPVVNLTAPSTGTVLPAGVTIGLAATATSPDGTVASVQFLANGRSVGSVATAPYTTTWTPSTAGTYTVIAQATDNSGNVAASPAVIVSVLANQAPIVSIAAPTNGSVITAGSGVTLNASASDPDGTIASVQFLINGVAFGAPITTLTSGTYRTQWTPAAAGVYTITATAADNSGAASSTSATVLAVSAASGGGDTVYTGSLFGIGENGKFSVISISGKSAAFIGYSTVGAGQVYYYPSIPVNASGGFTLTDSSGRVLLAGAVSSTGATITTLNGASTTLIGITAFSSGVPVAAGYYTGSLAGKPASQVAAIVGNDGSIMLYATDGTASTAGAGAVDSAGIVTNVAALGGGVFNGKIDPLTKFLSGTLTGPSAGIFSGAMESGVSFSDGFLRNLSSRGQVGTGSNVLIAGFVVGGTTPKQVLIRAIGPSLAQFGITGALGDPLLQLFGGSGSNTPLSSNDNWGGAPVNASASSAVGAFPLSSTSLDSVIFATLTPGAYTAQVSGVNGVTGTALVELYDVDSPTPFSSQKVMNISTRAIVSPGQGQLIAGFVVNGSTSKKLLIRAVGPTLAASPFNVPGVLADPFLRLIRNSDSLVVRENDNWGTGNDVSLVNAAAVSTGAFALAPGSKDAVILITLPPGSYSALVSGNNSTSGVALVEVYEVP